MVAGRVQQAGAMLAARIVPPGSGVQRPGGEDSASGPAANGRRDHWFSRGPARWFSRDFVGVSSLGADGVVAVYSAITAA